MNDITPIAALRGVNALKLIQGLKRHGKPPVVGPPSPPPIVKPPVPSPPAPTAAFSASPTSGTSPLQVFFTDSSTGSPASWFWDFGDGATSNVQNPSHTYSVAGSFTAKLTVSNSVGSGSLTQAIAVAAPVPAAPVANFQFSPTTGNSPLLVNFTDTTAGTVTSWSWDFGDGNISTQQNPQHTFASTGNFVVKLTSTGPGGSSTSLQTVVVTAAPIRTYEVLPYSTGTQWNVWIFQVGDATATSYTIPGWGFDRQAVFTKATASGTVIVSGQSFTNNIKIEEFTIPTSGTSLVSTGKTFNFGLALGNEVNPSYRSIGVVQGEEMILAAIYGNQVAANQSPTLTTSATPNTTTPLNPTTLQIDHGTFISMGAAMILTPPVGPPVTVGAGGTYTIGSPTDLNQWTIQSASVSQQYRFFYYKFPNPSLRTDFAYRTSASVWSTINYVYAAGGETASHSMAIGPDNNLYHILAADASGGTAHLVRVKRVSGALQIVDTYVPFLVLHQSPNITDIDPQGEFPIFDVRSDPTNNRVVLCYQRFNGTIVNPAVTDPGTGLQQRLSLFVLTSVSLATPPVPALLINTGIYGDHLQTASGRIFPESAGIYMLLPSWTVGQTISDKVLGKLNTVTSQLDPWITRDDVPSQNTPPQVSDDGYWVDNLGNVHSVGPFPGQQIGTQSS